MLKRLTAVEHIFNIYHLPRVSLRARNFVRSDSRGAADTVGVNGIYVPVECILIIHGGIFEAATQYVRTWNFHTVRHVCVPIRSWWLRFIHISGSLIRLVLLNRYISNGKRYRYLNTLAFIWKLTGARRYIVPCRHRRVPRHKIWNYGGWSCGDFNGSALIEFSVTCALLKITKHY